MSDLIRRSTLLEQIKSQMPQFGGGIISQTISVCTDVAVELVKAAPAVDAVPVVHGWWVMRNPDKYGYTKPKCSVCGEYHLSDWSDYTNCNYCPNCGAKMDGGNDG